MKALNVTQNKVLANTLLIADTFVSSFIGLMGKRSLTLGHGLWIIPCQSVHTFWMRFSIDVIFLDRNRVVIQLVERLRPFRISKHISRAVSVMELPANTIVGTHTHLGDQIEVLE
jgi:uncharacterized membrane protein (UPF0127 family)